MARGQAQFMRIFDSAATYGRWHNFYINGAIVFEGQIWGWLPFDADGFTDGGGSVEGDLTITIPATPGAVAEIEGALRSARLAQVSTYEFDILDDGAIIAPITDQTLIASYVGEVVSAGGALESLELQLGSSLSPVGSHIPPRLFSTRLIGAPCKL